MTAAPDDPIDEYSVFAELFEELDLDEPTLYAWATAPTAHAQIQLALPLLASESDKVAGWLAGMTMFVDFHGRIAKAIEASSRFEIIPSLLMAFAAGAELAPGPRVLWPAIARLVLRTPWVPRPFLAWLPRAVCTRPPRRDVAIQIAASIPTSRDAILAARDAGELDVRALDFALARIPTIEGDARTRLLERALEEWRRTRAMALVDPIVLLGDAIARVREPLLRESTQILERKPAPFSEDKWLAIARRDDPGDLDRLIDVPWPSDPSAALARCKVLAVRAPDPRLARLADLALAHHRWPASVHAQIAALLEAAAGEHLRSRIDPLVAASPRRLELAAYARVSAAIDANPSQAADASTLVDVEAGTSRLREIATLLATHAKDPSDLALLAVLGDAFVEQQDPRGELISRAMRSEHQARDYLLGRAFKLLGRIPFASVGRYDRGALVTVHVSCDPDQLRASLDRSDWATVEQLGLDCDIDPAEVLARLPRIRVLDFLTPAALDRLVETGPHPQLRGLGVLNGRLPPDLRAFPNLVAIGACSKYYQPEPDNYAVRVAALRIPVLVHFHARGVYRKGFLAARGDGPRCIRTSQRNGFVGLDEHDTGWILELAGTRAFASQEPGSNPEDVHTMTFLVEALRAAGISRLSVHFPLQWKHYPAMRDEVAAKVPEVELDFDGPRIDLAGPASA